MATAAPPSPLRIESLSLRAYRAFSAEQVIAIGGRNAIVYGENGAGKSSIYRALRDLFARRPVLAALANNAHVHRLDESITPRVKIQFNDGQAAVEWTPARHPGRPTADPRVAMTALRSSFLDYHALLETNAFHGQKRPNLFNLAVETLLADFADATSSKTIAEHWSDTINAKPIKHPYSGGYLGPVEAACAVFNATLEAALQAALPIINALLINLGHGEMKIDGFERGTVRYNNARLKKDRGFEGRELFARLDFRGHQPVTPQHFLNEARLSALALAFYLAGRLACVPSAPSPALKLLVLDDVLVGLDYSNRRPLLAVLENHFADWQIFLLTHDRHWFEIVRAAIPSDRWTCHEMYEMVALTGQATPYLRPVPSDIVKATLAQATKFVADKHLPAAANYARSACEIFFRKFCEKKGLKFPYKSDPKQLSFEKLKTAIEAYFHDSPVKLAAVKAIDPFQTRILNPLSHDPATSLNQAEVEAAIDAVNKLVDALRN
jgi:energy-coupling factor transporter ATP-binding protein EcfA2